MSREMRIVLWCDACQRGGKAVEAVQSFTLGLHENEDADAGEPPALFTLDLCSKHAQDVLDPVAKLLTEAVPFVRRHQVKAAPSRSQARPKATTRRDEECPVCFTVMRRSSLITHIWNVHRPGDLREQPTHCPDCGQEFSSSPQAMGVHRRLSHDWDAVADAVAGIRR